MENEYNSVENIRQAFSRKYKQQDFVIDKSGCKMIELVGISFVADEPTIFGEVNYDYANREIQWYESQSLNVNDIPGKTPEIWKNVADENGFINSNYGYLIYSEENGNQYKNVLEELKNNSFSRRAIMVYTRPSIWEEYNKNGMSDFICTNGVSYLMRNEKLHACVQMRSNDVVFGFRNDAHWQFYVLASLATELNVKPGHVHWNASSLHIYERDFWRVDGFIRTSNHKLTKKEFDALESKAHS